MRLRLTSNILKVVTVLVGMAQPEEDSSNTDMNWPEQRKWSILDTVEIRFRAMFGKVGRELLPSGTNPLNNASAEFLWPMAWKVRHTQLEYAPPAPLHPWPDP